ncbi:ABC transporter ATP-binding protein [Methyloversatilis sp.]|uniref:ABC transporter ATP-binding protein n=1 Tax=Methyloversatilis sp. TaxID=2569862 RepID=UPI002733564E|nr:ABC transporter ATP-binding protein [Methyloversatilis sp.]MDP2870846.1 ABC transporter ATP-binding protein [Methyloversatilis sp.]MDP3456177.1 ABC transporter ATP-binding protein [Methyloversatilis sp.]MDP3577129.1 ABC transporter ATP-binding protein [Methyloversatilis sp.]
MKDSRLLRADAHFRLTDVPRAIRFFLDTDRRRYLLFICVLGVVQFYPMLPPYLIGQVADFLIGWQRGDSLTPMYTLIATLGVAHAVVALVRLSTKRVIGRMSIDARMRAKVWGFERLLGFSLGWHQKESTGNKAQRVLTGADAVRDWTSELVNALLTASGAFFGALIACMLLHPATVFFFLYYCGVLGFIEWYFYRRIAKLSDQINASMENASGSFVESAANILSVKAMNAGADMTARVAAREQAARDFAYRRLRLTNTKWMLFQLHTALAWSLYILGVAWGVMEGGLSVGLVLTYTAYFNTLREASMDMTDRVQTMIERTSNLGRMMPLFAPQAAQHGTLDWPADWRALQAESLTFAHDGRRVLGPLDFTIRRGEHVGIAGRSGSGKSTLVKLLLALYPPESGRLAVDEVPLSDIRHEALLHQIAVVPQETELFSLSLRDNLTLGRDVSELALLDACRIAQLDDVIALLPDGLDSPVGEKGHSLSGGQRQRVGIARAVLRDAPVLLLDEATSALDADTEARVIDALMSDHAPGRTVILIAHRPRAFERMGRVLTMDAGQLVGPSAAVPA